MGGKFVGGVWWRFAMDLTKVQCGEGLDTEGRRELCALEGDRTIVEGGRKSDWTWGEVQSSESRVQSGCF